MIRENINISAKESRGYFGLKKNRPWFDKRCSKLLGQRKQAKLQWLQDPSEVNRYTLNNVRCEVIRYFRNKKREYLKDKINELATNSKNNRGLYRGINAFKKRYPPRNTLLKDETGALLADFHSILNRWKNYFSQLLNVHNVSDVRQIEVHTAEPLVLGPSHVLSRNCYGKVEKV
jgi:tRNA(Ile)-lysidine synthase TilS/MesJ